ncbi:HAD-IC family P-type ATPase [Alloscardovia omnicolens]|uniref:HAD-IC family P-type ATPase n=1 Tax=Alloscardovia omnicolens TaxID=419015 RepID=UPI003A6516D1
MIFAYCAVALLISIGLLWYFFAPHQGEHTNVANGKQDITISVNGSYSPALIHAQAGVPLTLYFDRKDSGECTSHVIFPDLKTDTYLASGRTTAVHLPALSAGEYPFSCGMNMVHGMLKVSGTAPAHEADTSNTDNITKTDMTPDSVLRSDNQANSTDTFSSKNTDNSSTEDIDNLKKKLIIGAIFSIPVFILGMGSMMWGHHVPSWLNNPWIQAILATPVMFYTGWDIHRIGWSALIHRNPEMNALVTVGTSAAYVFSLLVCIAPGVLPENTRHVYFDTVVVVLTLVVLGSLIESKARAGTNSAIEALMALRPDTARVLSAEELSSQAWKLPDAGHEISMSQIRTGDIIQVSGGHTVPTDGVIIKGSSRFDESMMTGESEPVERSEGEQITGGTLSLNAPVAMQVTATGKDTVLSQIIQLVSSAQASKAPVQAVADKIARVFVPTVFLIALWTFTLWLSFAPQSSLSYALTTAVTVLIIACPCALGLATPLSITAAIGRGAQYGILISSADALDKARHIRTIFFDKTGTITEGIASVENSSTAEISYSNDHIKATSAQALAELKSMGIRTIMLSGDKAEVAKDVARQAGLDTVIAQVKPDGKAFWISHAQRQQTHQHNQLIAMVGDGINDAPALAQSDIGFAMGTGTDIAMKSADVTLMTGDILAVARMIRLSRATMRNIYENLAFAFAYNAIGLVIATGVLYPFTGWLLNPMIAGLAMAFSSVSLILNSSRLRGVRLDSSHVTRIQQSHNPQVIIDDEEHSQQGELMFDFLKNKDKATPAPQSSSLEDVLVDPICGMTVTAEQHPFAYGSRVYHFCSEHCLETFKAEPAKYAQ